MPVTPSLTNVQFDSSKMNRGSHNVVSYETLTSRGSLNTVSKGTLMNRGSSNAVLSQSSQPKLPPISHNSSIVSVTSVEVEHANKLDHHTIDESEKRGAGEEEPVRVVSNSHDKVSSTVRAQLQSKSKMTRKSVFKDAPLGFKPITLRKQHHSSVAVQTPPPSPSPPSEGLPSGGGDDLTDGVSGEERTTLQAVRTIYCCIECVCSTCMYYCM